MLFQELKVGEKLELHVKWGGMEYEIPSKVEFINKKTVIINAYSYSGNTIDFQSKTFRDVVIDLYVKNHNGKRYCWRDIKLVVVNYFGRNFYQVKTHEFKKFSEIMDRRNHPRVKLKGKCLIRENMSEAVYEGRLVNVSRDGIAFCCREDSLKGGVYEISFSDHVRKHSFNLKMNVRVVRGKKEPSGVVVYGCRILEASRDCLAYIYLKSIDDSESEAS